MAGEISNLSGIKAPVESYIDKAGEMAKGAGLSAKATDVVKSIAGILAGAGVTVTNKTEGTGETGKPSGATGLPALDNPDSVKNKQELLEKLVAYLQLDNEKRQTEMAKERIESQKANLDTEHKTRADKIDETLKKMDDAEKARKASRVLSWLGAIFAVIAAVVVTIVTGGAAAGFAIAGAAFAVASLVASETGLTDKLIESIAKSMEEDGMSKNDAKLKAALIVNLSIMAIGLALSGGALGVSSVASAAEGTAKLIQTIVTVANTVTGVAGLVAGGVNTGLSYKAQESQADVTELEKFLTMLQQRLEESEEELNAILQQLQNGIASLADLLSSVTDTETEIANNIGQMA